MVGDIWLLTAEIARQVLRLDRLGAKPEVLLLKDEAPVEEMLLACTRIAVL